MEIGWVFLNDWSEFLILGSVNDFFGEGGRVWGGEEKILNRFLFERRAEKDIKADQRN